MNHGTLIIYSSPNGETDWTPMKAIDVPAWIRDNPELLARLVDGEACCDNDQTPAVWYVAQRVLTEDEQSILRAAIEKRMRRKGKRLARAEMPVLH